ncbi:DUF2889 domain-containing protein [Burkholderia territorii]|uniref:DUF2889 domain-containing protein n=1 Tax=Burkholderia territorii TaxID=1503055 RepID=UPI0009BCDF7E|nr:DUF2889 domain-containing protein [Burkholderia territorii]
MSLSNSVDVRERLHTRSITVDGYRREDGLWDIEGRLLDIRDRDSQLPSGVRRAGEPFHQMGLRFTLDDTLTILKVEAAMDAFPYAGACDSITSHYRQLIGLRIGKGFRRTMSERVGGLRGCSHITELVGAMAAGAVQTLGPFLNKKNDERPVQLGGCHAWAYDSALVKELYPQWHVPARQVDAGSRSES